MSIAALVWLLYSGRPNASMSLPTLMHLPLVQQGSFPALRKESTKEILEFRSYFVLKKEPHSRAPCCESHWPISPPCCFPASLSSKFSLLGPPWVFILKTFGVSQTAVQIGIRPGDWEEAGSSAKAKLIIEIDGWLWIEMGPYTGTGSEKLLMPHIKCTGPVFLSLSGEGCWGRSCQWPSLISVSLP